MTEYRFERFAIFTQAVSMLPMDGENMDKAPTMDAVVSEISEPVEEHDKTPDGGDIRSFWTMVLLAIQNAINDKAAQTFLTAIGVFMLSSDHMAEHGNSFFGLTSSEVAPTLSMLILAPFIFLAPLAGWLSDRFSKTNVLRGAALMQLAVLALILLAVHQREYLLGVLGFALLALQSTLLSPAKKGIVKEMMGSERLGFASGVVELTSVLAICVGQILSGFWYEARFAETKATSAIGDGWGAVQWPILLLFILAIPAFLATLSIRVYPSPSKRPFKIAILWEHVGQMKDLLGDSRIRLSALAIAFFWFIGGFVNIVAFQVGNLLTGGGSGYGTELALMLGFASGGMILGGAVASLSSRRSIELGLVPIGGILMVIGCIAIACVPISSIWFKIWIAFVGFGAAIFLVPLNANLQDKCDEDKRGKVIAGSNLLDSIAGAIGVIAHVVMLNKGVSIQTQFLIVGALCAVVTIYATRILPQHFIRFTLLTVIRVFYRQKTLHAERLPKEGGVLIVPNHVSFIDAFILTGASTRPIRFLVTDEYSKKGGIAWLFMKMFDAVPISEGRAKQAIQVASDAVQEGGVVCIFPEGQLTRTGCMNELKRGFEMIARKANCPVVPVYMDGLWGSIFSFERGKFVKKWPYRLQYGVTVTWGEPMEPREATSIVVREKLQQLGMEAFCERSQLAAPEKCIKGKVKVLAGDSTVINQLRSDLLSQPTEDQFKHVYNGLQLVDTHAICRGDTIAIRIDELEAYLAQTLAVVFPVLDKLKLVLISAETSSSKLKSWHDKHAVKSYFGGEKLKKQLADAGITDTEFYTVSEEQAQEGVYPMKVNDGKVIALSMPHPPMVAETNEFQAGWKEGSYGKVLTGYLVDYSEDPECEAKVNMLDETLCLGKVDKEGFLSK